jgi:hypothetical protein
VLTNLYWKIDIETALRIGVLFSSIFGSDFFSSFQRVRGTHLHDIILYCAQGELQRKDGRMCMDSTEIDAREE